MLLPQLVLLFGFAISPQSANTEQISGDVINSATGAPISDALVVATYGARTAAGKQETKRIVTGPTGHFSISGTERPQSIQVSRNGFRSEEGYDTASVYPKSDAKHVTVKLMPLAAITGRVLNGDGEPIPGLRIQALAISIANGRRTYKPYASFNTDDRGVFRLWHFTPNKYCLVMLGQMAAMTSLGSVIISDLGQAYGPVFYPSSSNRAGSQEVVLHPGEEFQADFVVDSHVAYRIRGTIQGFPSYQRALIRLLRNGEETGNRTLLNPSSGAFEIYDVAPGTYQLQAYSVKSTPNFTGETTVTVGDKDTTGVVVSGMEGIPVHGQVQIPSGSGLRGRGVVVATPIESRWPEGQSAVSASYGADGKFKLEGLLPGVYEIALQGITYASSITSGSVDVIESGLNVTDAGVPDLKIETAATGTSVTVHLIPSEAAGDSDLMHSIVALRQYKGRTIAVTVKSYGENPGYLNTLPPGDYLVYAWKGRKEIEYHNASIMATLSAYATALSAQSGGTQEITVKEIPAAELP